MYLLYGTPIHVSEHVVEKVWVFPKDRFVEYEPSDEWWCRKYGFGHEETRPAVYRVGVALHFHPVRWEQFCELAELEPDNDYLHNDLVSFKSRAVERHAEQVARRNEEHLKRLYELSFAAPSASRFDALKLIDVVKEFHRLRNDFRVPDHFDFTFTATPCLKRPEADFELRPYSRYEAVNSLVPKNIALCTV
jgi:hypothetical protein